MQITKNQPRLEDIANIELLRHEFAHVRDAAPGVDGLTRSQFARHLDRNLEELVTELGSGNYVPSPVRVVSVGDEKPRYVGMATVRDKIVQRAMSAVLAEALEPEFHLWSFARRGLGRVAALQYLSNHLTYGTRRYAITVDIEKCFDSIPLDPLKEHLESVIESQGVLELVNKVIQQERVDETGEPMSIKGLLQGGPLSSLLVNAYLHRYVDDEIDVLFHPEKPCVARYIDDICVLCNDPEPMKTSLRRIMKKAGLRLKTTKTRVVDFEARESLPWLGALFTREPSRRVILNMQAGANVA
jgi:retron-type reverse transcriptase